MTFYSEEALRCERDVITHLIVRGWKRVPMWMGATNEDFTVAKRIVDGCEVLAIVRPDNPGTILQTWPVTTSSITISNEIFVIVNSTPVKSDKEQLMELLAKFGAGFDAQGAGEIVCQSHDAKNSGKGGSYTKFAFDIDGKFVSMGAFE